MKKKIIKIFLTSQMLLLLVSCQKEGEQAASGTTQKSTLHAIHKEPVIFIIMDTIDDWSSGIRNGFQQTLDALLKKYNVNAKYMVHDTKLKEENVPAIIESIKKNNPDLICTINFPSVFADTMIARKLTDPKYKFVSENCIPIQSGTIKSWEHPGGNITGVGVFLQMNSPLRLMKKINPKANKLVFYSWDQVPLLNKWFKKEITRACQEEGIKLAEFREVPHQEATLKLFTEYNKKGKNYFFMTGISAFIHENGQPADDRAEVVWTRMNANFPSIAYEETQVQYGNLAGTCVVWYDIGAQLAEKGLRILEGEDPGSIPWEYPRKYNIIINKKRARSLRITIPHTIISAAYRIYTDYKGTFIGQEK